MEEYVLYRYSDTGERRYLEAIYKTSTSSDKDIADAIKFDSKEVAIAVKNYLNSRDSYQFKVCKMETSVEDIEE